MYTYNELNQMFETCRNKDSGKPLGNNTRLFKRGKNLAIRLHNTDVVTVTPKNEFILNTGGWHTVTTKDRINSYSPSPVYSVKGVWNVFNNSKPESVYYDGIKLDKNGHVISKVISPDKKIAELKKLKLKIKKYVDAYCKHIESGKLELPSGGDCYYCQGLVTNFESGNRSTSSEHLLSHIKERYFVPSLLVNAIKDNGLMTEFWFYSIQSGRDTRVARRVLTKYLLKNLRKD
jgi:hypothetical protein